MEGTPPPFLRINNTIKQGYARKITRKSLHLQLIRNAPQKGGDYDSEGLLFRPQNTGAMCAKHIVEYRKWSLL